MDIGKRELCRYCKLLRMSANESAGLIAGIYGCSRQNILQFEAGVFNSNLFILYLNRYKHGQKVIELIREVTRSEN